MKKFFQGGFRKLSLTQQVMVLILMMVVFLVMFFMFFLSDSVDTTINAQMYDMLEARQKPIVQAIEVGKSAQNDRELFDYISADANIRTAIVTSDKSIEVSEKNDPEAEAFLATLIPKARRLLAENPRPAPALSEELSAVSAPVPPADEAAPAQTPKPASNPVKEGYTNFQNMRYYYRIERVDYLGNPTVVVSFMNNTYAQEIRASLMDSTIYITVLVFFLMLMVLLFWVFSIIHPLNQIKSYISQIKEGKDVDLYINRGDEIGEVATELRTLTSELAKQQKSKEEMIHNISHDLKTPIATIKSYSESIKDGIYPYGDLESSVDVILDNANRLEQKVHSLLYMNRVEYLVSSDAEGVVTNMKEVVEEVVLNAAVIRPEIRLITDLEDVYFDGLLEAWRVCIENILQNAFRYAKSYIKIETRENEIRISNDGPKMDEDRIQSLFLPYIKGEGGRFGLGLSIVSKVVQANNYKVEGMNTKDGVCFRIWRDVPKNRQSRFKTNGNSVLNMQNWGSPRRAQSNQNKKAAPDQKQESKPSRNRNNAGRKNQKSINGSQQAKKSGEKTGDPETKSENGSAERSGKSAKNQSNGSSRRNKSNQSSKNSRQKQASSKKKDSRPKENRSDLLEDGLLFEEKTLHQQAPEDTSIQPESVKAESVKEETVTAEQIVQPEVITEQTVITEHPVHETDKPATDEPVAENKPAKEEKKLLPAAIAVSETTVTEAEPEPKADSTPETKLDEGKKPEPKAVTETITTETEILPESDQKESSAD